MTVGAAITLATESGTWVTCLFSGPAEFGFEMTQSRCASGSGAGPDARSSVFGCACDCQTACDSATM